MIQHLDSHTKGAMDAVAGAAVVGTLVGLLPSIAAALGIIWYCCLIYSWVVNKGWKPKK